MKAPFIDIQKLKEFKEAVRVLSDLTDHAAPLHQTLVFLETAYAQAKGESIEVAQIADVVDLSTSSTSRNVAALGEWHRSQRAGLQLIKTETDFSDRRRKPVVLTKKGETVVGLALDKIK